MKGFVREDYIARNGLLLSGIIKRDQCHGSRLLKIGRLPRERLAQLPVEKEKGQRYAIHVNCQVKQV